MVLALIKSLGDLCGVAGVAGRLGLAAGIGAVEFQPVFMALALFSTLAFAVLSTGTRRASTAAPNTNRAVEWDGELTEVVVDDIPGTALCNEPVQGWWGAIDDPFSPSCEPPPSDREQEEYYLSLAYSNYSIVELTFDRDYRADGFLRAAKLEAAKQYPPMSSINTAVPPPAHEGYLPCTGDLVNLQAFKGNQKAVSFEEPYFSGFPLEDQLTSLVSPADASEGQDPLQPLAPSLWAIASAQENTARIDELSWDNVGDAVASHLRRRAPLDNGAPDGGLQQTAAAIAEPQPPMYPPPQAGDVAAAAPAGPPGFPPLPTRQPLMSTPPTLRSSAPNKKPVRKRPRDSKHQPYAELVQGVPAL